MKTTWVSLDTETVIEIVCAAVPTSVEDNAGNGYYRICSVCGKLPHNKDWRHKEESSDKDQADVAASVPKNVLDTVRQGNSAAIG